MADTNAKNSIDETLLGPTRKALEYMRECLPARNNMATRMGMENSQIAFTVKDAALDDAFIPRPPSA